MEPLAAPQRAAELPARLLAVLRCPRCGSPLEQIPAALRCGQGHAFPRGDHVDLSSRPESSAVARTFESFGYEWTTFSEIKPEDEEYWRWYFRDVPLAELAGGIGLDAGCGKGRYTLFTARHLAAMIALDGSDAVTAAARNLEPVADHVAVVKGDLRAPPLAARAFDFISCLGVLHHLPDPEAGFQALADRLAPGGLFLVYVYSRPRDRGVRAAGLRAASLLRRVTAKMPHRPLRALSAPLALLLYGALVVPGAVGARLGLGPLARLPLHVYRGRPLRALWLDTFDRLSAPLEARYVPAEVEAWFERAGLDVEASREDAGLFVLGRRPRE